MKVIKMDHENVNSLLSYYFDEDSKRHHKRMQEHITGCQSCKQYLDDLSVISDAMAQWQDEEPEEDTLHHIMRDISVAGASPARARVRNPTQLACEIAGAMASIFLAIYMFQYSVTHSQLWNSIRDYWSVGSIGAFGLAVILFFAFSVFISLALTPIILFETQSNSSTAEVRH